MRWKIKSFGMCLLVIAVIGQTGAQGDPKKPKPIMTKISFAGLTGDTANPTKLRTATKSVGTPVATKANAGTDMQWPPVFWRPPPTEVDKGKDEGVDMIVDIISELATRGVTKDTASGSGEDGKDTPDPGTTGVLKIGLGKEGTGMFEKLNSTDVANAIRASVKKQMDTTEKAVNLFRGVMKDLFGDIMPDSDGMNPKELVEMILDALTKEKKGLKDLKELKTKVLVMLSGEVEDDALPREMVGEIITGIKDTDDSSLNIFNALMSQLGITLKNMPRSELLSSLIKFVYALNNTAELSNAILADRFVEAVFDEKSPCRLLLNELIDDILKDFSLNVTRAHILKEMQDPFSNVPKPILPMFVKALLDNCGGFNSTIVTILKVASSVLVDPSVDGKVTEKCDVSLLVNGAKDMLKMLDTSAKNTTLYVLRMVSKVFMGHVENKPLDTAIVKFVTAMKKGDEKDISEDPDLSTRDAKIKFVVEKTVEAIMDDDSLQRELWGKMLSYLFMEFGVGQSSDDGDKALDMAKTSFGGLAQKDKIVQYFTHLVSNCTYLSTIFYRTAEKLSLKGVVQVSDMEKCDTTILAAGLNMIAAAQDAKGKRDTMMVLGNITNMLTDKVREEDKNVAVGVHNFLKMFLEAPDSLGLVAHVFKAVDDWLIEPDVMSYLLSILSPAKYDAFSYLLSLLSPTLPTEDYNAKLIALRYVANSFSEHQTKSHKMQKLHFAKHMIKNSEDKFLAFGLVSGLGSTDQPLPKGVVSLLRALGPDDGDVLRAFVNQSSQIDNESSERMLKILAMVFSEDTTLRGNLLRDALAMMSSMPGDNTVIIGKLLDVFMGPKGNCTEDGLDKYKGPQSGAESMNQCWDYYGLKGDEMIFEKMMGVLFGSDNSVVKHLSNRMKKKGGKD